MKSLGMTSTCRSTALITRWVQSLKICSTTYIFFTTLLRLSLRRDSFKRKCAAICNSPQISVLIPECGILPANISSVINSFSPYYLVRNLPVYELLEETLLESLVKKGRRENVHMSISSILLFLVLNYIFSCCFLLFTQETSMRSHTAPKLMKIIRLHFFPAVSKIITHMVSILVFYPIK